MTARLAAFLALPLAAIAPAAAAAPPKLVVAISVDQFSGDLFNQYRQHFTGGLKRLANGVVFPAGYQSHNATETCPGHSTLLTGDRPARTGIIANNWFDLGLARPDKLVYCSEDPSVPGTDSDHYVVSSRFLRVPTLGDRMKRADPRARSVAVAGKDRAAVMMGGHDPDQRWYWQESRFETDLRSAKVPAAVLAARRSAAAALAQARDPMALPALCAAHSRAVALPAGKTVGTGRFERPAGDARAFRASPELDAAVLRLSADLRDEMGLGEGPATDLLAVSVSATDYVGHKYGNQGSEMCLQMLALDAALGTFLDRLDRTGIDYVVMLTADHGGQDLPERIDQHGLPAARVDPALAPKSMGAAIGARLGLKGPLLFGDGSFGDIYVDRKLRGADRRRVLAAAVAAYRAHPQVAAVFTAEMLKTAPSPSGPPDTWSLLDRARESFDPQRSGDFVVLLKPRVTPIADPSGTRNVATHGSPWDYDRRVPILFWRKGISPFEQSLAVETVDIAPTLAALVGLKIAPDEMDGSCLDLDEGEGTTCPAE